MSAERKGFAVKSRKYHMGLWEYMDNEENILRLGIAKKDEKILAMIVVAVYGDEVSTLYSAQTDTDSNLRATMLLRWECMLLGQKEGVKRFNNWGVLPDERYEKGNPGYGYSHYKRSFGGYLESIERTYEYSFKKLPHLLQRMYDWYIKLRYYRFR
jgi:lipid II:glycine glycyltransferase (peptidoglycan interpeptide bridge formation enzyme)